MQHEHAEDDRVAWLIARRGELETGILDHLAGILGEHRVRQVTVHVGGTVGLDQAPVAVGAKADHQGTAAEVGSAEGCPHRHPVRRAATDVDVVVVEVVVPALGHAAQPTFVEGEHWLAEQRLEECKGRAAVYHVQDRRSMGDI